MIYLVDAAVLLAALFEPDRLPVNVRRAIEAPKTRVLVSAAVAWDITLNAALGRVRFADKVAVWLPQAVADAGFTWLDVRPDHAVGIMALVRGAGELMARGDPFDRILASQAMIERATLLCFDDRMTRYGVPVLWR